MKVLFVAVAFNAGGAERQLLNLCQGLRLRGHQAVVGVFYRGGVFEPVLRSHGVLLHSLDRQGFWGRLRAVLRLRRLAQIERPDVIHTYLPSANVTAALARPLLRGVPIVWGIRASNMDLRRYPSRARVPWEAERLLSRIPELTIFNSYAGLDYHLASGYRPRQAVVIPNGINTSIFRPDPEAGRRLRAAWGAHERDIIIGLVGRLDPMKDHPTFLRAGHLIRRTRPNVRLLCIGEGPAAYRAALESLARPLGLDRAVIWSGHRDDMAAVYNAMDILTSASAFGEGFSNVVGEAMACGVPCVVTDVGDSARIVGESGIVVPPRNPQALAAGWAVMMARRDADGAKLREDVRARVVREFDIDRMVERTIEAMRALL